MQRSTFSLFQSHLDFSHHLWGQIVQKGDIVIDATCGNGHDSLELASLALTNDSGQLIGYDIQKQAIEQTWQRLKSHLSAEQQARVTLYQESHASFSKELHAESVRLIVYNLGYLPGGDKNVTTRVTSTIDSLDQAAKLIMPRGAISVTCYPGHPEGAKEQEALLGHVQAWSPFEWSCSHHIWLNRRQAPSLLILQRKL